MILRTFKLMRILKNYKEYSKIFNKKILIYDKNSTACFVMEITKAFLTPKI